MKFDWKEYSITIPLKVTKKQWKFLLADQKRREKRDKKLLKTKLFKKLAKAEKRFLK